MAPVDPSSLAEPSDHIRQRMSNANQPSCLSVAARSLSMEGLAIHQCPDLDLGLQCGLLNSLSLSLSHTPRIDHITGPRIRTRRSYSPAANYQQDPYTHSQGRRHDNYMPNPTSFTSRPELLEAWPVEPPILPWLAMPWMHDEISSSQHF